MGFLYFLENLRFPFMDSFMLLITQLGEETTFLVVALILFWCIDKRTGYYLLSVGFIGTLLNQFMKLLFRVPRPWVIDPSFTILEQAREAAGGYSFPSGHTQSAVGTFGVIAAVTKKRWIRITAVVIAVLVPFSRMYIGVHTPLDVLVAAAIAVGLIFLLKPVVLNCEGKHFPVLLAIMTAAAVGFQCFVSYYPFPSDIDTHNLQSGIKNACTLIGSLAGLLVVYVIDEKWIHFTTKAAWWVQLIKIAGGLILVLLVKSLLKTPLNIVFGESVGRSVRYALIVVSAGGIWPLTFRHLSQLGRKHSDGIK